MYELHIDDELFQVDVKSTMYTNNGGLAVLIHTEGMETEGEIVTTNIEFLPWGYAALDTNNFPWLEDFITENDLGESAGYSLTSGWCSYPVYRFSDKVLENVVLK